MFYILLIKICRNCFRTLSSLHLYHLKNLDKQDEEKRTLEQLPQILKEKRIEVKRNKGSEAISTNLDGEEHRGEKKKGF